jgi:hypothetical protein
MNGRFFLNLWLSQLSWRKWERAMSISEDHSGNVTQLADTRNDQADLLRAAGTNDINDIRFMDDLEKLKQLRSFLIEQAVQLGPTERTLSFGDLNLLRYRPNGRSPSLPEWMEMEQLTQELFGHLSDPLRRRFLYSNLPWWVAQVAVVLGITAVVSLVVCTFLPRLYVLPFYLGWLASLGAVGSLAFIGMNALAVQDDATFDLSSGKLLVLRITLGALFAVVLTLPFGFEGFLGFIDVLSFRGPPKSDEGIKLDSLLLLLPFVLGFSTSLVIMVLNQFVEAIQSFFGKRTVATSSPATPTPVAPPPAVSPLRP